mmetsp:Transcript_55553/g.136295  ORF Transcript_55553/g.136295 Transcript_55553/m.136295 type:complete len:402 (-) Transcript_55553:301-1506(-)
MIAAVAAAVAAATIAAATPAADVRDDHAALGALSCEQLFEQFGAYYGRKKSLYPPTSLDDELDDALHAQQHVDEGTCAHRRLLLYEPHDCGLGAELHWTAVMLHAALVTNRTLVIREDVPWLYAGTSERCAHRGGQFSCYFAPLSTCTARTAVELQALLGNDYAGIADVPWFRTTALAENHDARVVRFVTNLQDQLDARFQRSAAPTWHTAFYTNAALRAATTPEFWFRSRLMNFLWRPRDELRAAAAATRARLGLGRFDAHTCVALHTRRGDKVHGSPSNGVEMADVVGVARPLRVLAAIAARCPDVQYDHRAAVAVVVFLLLLTRLLLTLRLAPRTCRRATRPSSPSSSAATAPAAARRATRAARWPCTGTTAFTATVAATPRTISSPAGSIARRRRSA